MTQTLLKENDSVIWAGTNKGLCRIRNIQNPSKVKFTVFDVDDGVASNGINELALAYSDIWAGTMNGISIIPINKEIGYRHSIPVYLESLTVRGKLLKKPLQSSFSYDQDRFRFSYTAIDFQYPDKLIYKYRLLPSDNKWSFTRERSIIYNSLQPGKYTFELTVVNPFHPMKADTLRYTFEIFSPFWRTWWFINGSILLALAGIYVVVNKRIRLVKRQEKIKTDLSLVREKALRAQMNPHFVYNSLNSIQNYIIQHDTSSSLNFLSKFSRLMRLTFSNTDMPLVTLESDLEALILYTDLENLRFKNRFEFRRIIPDKINVRAIRIPPLLIQPFVENAILHGLLPKPEGGYIQLSIDVIENVLRIEIQDDGVGRKHSAAIAKKKSKYAMKGNNTERKNTGISVTKARIEQAWGNLSVKNIQKSEFEIVDLYNNQNLPAGTLVRFNLPITYV